MDEHDLWRGTIWAAFGIVLAFALWGTICGGVR